MHPRLAGAGPWLRREGRTRRSTAAALRRWAATGSALVPRRSRALGNAAPSSPRASERSRVGVAEAVIAAVARGAALSCYGVVHLASPPAVAPPSPPRSPTAGWRRWRNLSPAPEGRLAVELDVVLAGGLPAAAVGRNVVAAVSYQVERALGLPVDRVDVVVSGLRAGTDGAGLG